MVRMILRRLAPAIVFPAVAGLVAAAAAVPAASPRRQPNRLDLLKQANVVLAAGLGGVVGASVASAGDVNGDGLADVIVGAPGRNGAYVVFGQRTVTRIDLSNLGSDGFRIDGGRDPATCGRVDPGTDGAGASVAGIGDVNGDGLADVIVGAPLASDDNGHCIAGSAFVVFGKASSSTVSLGALGPRGFRIDGPAAGGVQVGISVAGAGDVNGDGRPDVIVGANVNEYDQAYSGKPNVAYVVFGKSSTSTVDLGTLGAQGFALDPGGVNFQNVSVAGAGDVNGDGLADVIVGLPTARTDVGSLSGAAYVVFGKSSSSPVDLDALGAQGFRIDGAAKGYAAGAGVGSVGDVNGDGRPDLVVGDPYFDPLDRRASGAVYVVFGKASTSTVHLGALGPQGYRIEGPAANSLAGISVAGVGDLNGDGRPDLILGTNDDDSGRSGSGAAYVVYGKSSTSNIDLNSLGAHGFRIDAPPGGSVGWAVAGAGDFNADGHPDLIVGAPFANYRTRPGSGSAYLIYGLGSLSVSGFAISPRTFAVGSSATPINAHARRGATFRYSLSHTATARITIARAAAGRRSRGKCRAATRKLRRARSCTRFITVGSIIRKAQRTGENTVRFSGRIGRRPLLAGRYRATISATDLFGTRSKPKTTSFRIVTR